MKRLFLIALFSCWAGVSAYAQCNQVDWVCVGNPYKPGSGIGASPTCASSANPAQARKIQDAYDFIAAVPSLAGVARDLCQVKHILLYPSPGHSWGQYNDPHLHPSGDAGSTYIGLSISDLNQSFRAVQDSHLGVAPHVPPGLIKNIANPPSAEDPRYGLVYILSHELGHIKWHQQYPLTGPQPGIPCYDTYFSNPSWGGNTDAAKHNRWTDFGADGNLGTPTGVTRPQNANTPHQIYQIYTNGFTTALSAANPEEDFVEAYASGILFRVATLSCPTCVFAIQFPQDGTVPLDGRPQVDQKINSCAATLY